MYFKFKKNIEKMIDILIDYLEKYIKWMKKIWIWIYVYNYSSICLVSGVNKRLVSQLIFLYVFHIYIYIYINIIDFILNIYIYIIILEKNYIKEVVDQVLAIIWEFIFIFFYQIEIEWYMMNKSKMKWFSNNKYKNLIWKNNFILQDIMSRNSF